MNKTCETNVKAILSKKGLQHKLLNFNSIFYLPGHGSDQGANKNIETNDQKNEND